MDHFPLLLEEEYQYNSAAVVIKRLISEGDGNTRFKLKKFAADCPEKFLQILKDTFADWTDNQNPQFLLKDGSPFLGNIPKDTESKPDDDIPF